MTVEEYIDELMERIFGDDVGSTSDHTSSSDGEVSDGDSSDCDVSVGDANDDEAPTECPSTQQ